MFFFYILSFYCGVGVILCVDSFLVIIFCVMFGIEWLILKLGDVFVNFFIVGNFIIWYFLFFVRNGFLRLGVKNVNLYLIFLGVFMIFLKM